MKHPSGRGRVAPTPHVPIVAVLILSATVLGCGGDSKSANKAVPAAPKKSPVAKPPAAPAPAVVAKPATANSPAGKYIVIDDTPPAPAIVPPSSEFTIREAALVSVPNGAKFNVLIATRRRPALGKQFRCVIYDRSGTLGTASVTPPKTEDPRTGQFHWRAALVVPGFDVRTPAAFRLEASLDGTTWKPAGVEGRFDADLVAGRER